MKKILLALSVWIFLTIPALSHETFMSIKNTNWIVLFAPIYYLGFGNETINLCTAHSCNEINNAFFIDSFICPFYAGYFPVMETFGICIPSTYTGFAVFCYLNFCGASPIIEAGFFIDIENVESDFNKSNCH